MAGTQGENHDEREEETTNTLPTTNHAGAEELSTFVCGQSRLGKRVIRKECIELGNELLELTEGQEPEDALSILEID